MIRGRVTFLGRIQVFSVKVNVYSFSFLLKPQPARDYHQKPNVRVASQNAELHQQSRTYDLCCFKRLFIWVFIDFTILELVNMNS